MDRRIFLVIKIVLTAIFVAAGAIYVWIRKDEFARLDLPAPLPVLLVATAFIVSVALRSTYNFLVARKLGAAISMVESFLLSVVVTAGNFVMPAGIGMGLRAFYMKRVHDFPVAYFAGGMIVFIVANILLVSLLALLLLSLVYATTSRVRVDVVVMFLATVVIGAVVMLKFRGGRLPQRRKTVGWFDMLTKGLNLIAGDRRLGVSLVVIVGANFVIASITWVVALRDFAPDAAILDGFLLSASQIIAGFVNLTPGAAGFQELAALYIGQTFAMTTVQLFAVLLWVRAVRMIVALTLAGPAVVLLRRAARLRRGTPSSLPAK